MSEETKLNPIITEFFNNPNSSTVVYLGLLSEIKGFTHKRMMLNNESRAKEIYPLKYDRVRITRDMFDNGEYSEYEGSVFFKNVKKITFNKTTGYNPAGFAFYDSPVNGLFLLGGVVYPDNPNGDKYHEDDIQLCFLKGSIRIGLNPKKEITQEETEDIKGAVLHAYIMLDTIADVLASAAKAGTGLSQITTASLAKDYKITTKAFVDLLPKELKEVVLGKKDRKLDEQIFLEGEGIE